MTLKQYGIILLFLSLINTIAAHAYTWKKSTIEQKDFSTTLHACLAPLVKDKKTISLSPAQLDEKCVIPYINGAWLDTHWLLRVPAMVLQEAHDTLIKKQFAGQKDIVYYPAVLPAFKKIIEAHGGNSDQLAVRALPLEKPVPGFKAGDALYNHIGLLYLPNAYGVPGGIFDAMYGWDSYFIILGMLESAKYLYVESTRQHSLTIMQLTADNQARLETISAKKARALAVKLFNIAKGMVDNHIFEIDFYGGYVLNANRAYYLTRSQPPLFLHEALLVYNFYQKYKQKMGLSYIETLATNTQSGRQVQQQLNVSYKNAKLSGFSFIKKFQTPQSMQAWLRDEVLPAAYAYFAYWTSPDLNYDSWNPYLSATYEARSNPRVKRIDGHDYYVYATAGVGPAPEVVYSTQPQNQLLYRGAILYFKNEPQHNPNQLYWRPQPPDISVFKQLTNYYYSQDRQVRASGYDLSGRFGVEGQLIGQYGNIALTSLLYKMGADLLTTIKLTKVPEARTVHTLTHWMEQTKHNINRHMWQQIDKHDGLCTDLPDNKQLPYVYNGLPYGTMFYPLWAGAADPKAFNATIAYAQTPLNVHLIDVSYHFTHGELHGNRIEGSVRVVKSDHYQITKRRVLRVPLIGKYGVVTSLVRTGDQWDFPNAWAPINYFAEGALSSAKPGFGDYRLSSRIRSGWIMAVSDYFAKTGLITEKYNVTNPLVQARITHGYSKDQIGFGWSNGVFMDFYNLNH